MKRPPLLLIGFTHYNNNGIVAKTNFIVGCMTGNILYPDAGTKLTDVSTALTVYLAALAKKRQVLNYKEIKTAARKVLNAALKTLGTYVNNKYPLNTTNWLTSGFDVQTFDGVTKVPDAPVNAKTKDAPNSGSAIVVFDKALFAEYYEGRNWKQGDPIPAGMTATSKSQKMLFDAMTAGDTWNFQVRSRGTKGVSDWGPQVSMIVR